MLTSHAVDNSTATSQKPLTFGSLFSGIGGMDLGLEQAGLICQWQVEKDHYARQVLAKHWPDVRRWEDIRTFPPEPANNWRVDIICGGPPCQPISCAGRRKAKCDPRWLWGDMLRAIRVLEPRYALMENPAGLLDVGMGFGDVLGGLADIGYDAEWLTFSASAVGAPHERNRLFVVAYSINAQHKVRRSKTSGTASSKEASSLGRPGEVRNGNSGVGVVAEDAGATNNGGGNTPPRRSTVDAKPVLWIGRMVFEPSRFASQLPAPCWGSDKPGVVRTSHGVPHRVDRIRGLGNAVVPAVAKWIGECIVAFDRSL